MNNDISGTQNVSDQVRVLVEDNLLSYTAPAILPLEFVNQRVEKLQHVVQSAVNSMAVLEQALAHLRRVHKDYLHSLDAWKNVQDMLRYANGAPHETQLVSLAGGPRDRAAV